VDWDTLFQLLKRRHFDGFFSIDLEKLPDLSAQFVRARRFLEENATRYGL
jgi:sugar phosphate isomerase/epimerase